VAGDGNEWDSVHPVHHSEHLQHQVHPHHLPACGQQVQGDQVRSPLVRQITIAYQQCFGSALDPHSMGSWIRIANADPDPEEGKSAPKKKKN
jgi:hypothetical protein